MESGALVRDLMMPQLLVWLGGLALHLLVAAALIRNSHKHLPIVHTYVGALAASILAGLGFYLTPGQSEFHLILPAVVLELTGAALALVVVLSVAADAVPDRRRAIVWSATAMGALLWTGALALYRTQDFWATQAVRNLTFLAALATLAVWFMLLARRPRDIVMITIAGGLGLQLSGTAMGYALHQFATSPALSGTATLLAIATDCMCLLLWWQAFNRSAPRDMRRA